MASLEAVPNHHDPASNDIESSLQEETETAFSKFQSVISPTRPCGKRKKAYGSVVTHHHVKDDDKENALTTQQQQDSVIEEVSLFESQDMEPRSSLFLTQDDDGMDVPDDGDDVSVEQENQDDDDVSVEQEVKGGRSKRNFQKTIQQTEETPTAEESHVQEDRVEESDKDQETNEAEDSTETTTVPEQTTKKPTVDSDYAAIKDNTTEPAKETHHPTTTDSSASATQDALFACVDRHYVQADKDAVTVGDIVRSVQTVLGIVIDKRTKKLVRNHLKNLITGVVEPIVENGNKEDENTTEEEEELSEEEAEESEQEVSEYEDEEEEQRQVRMAKRKKNKNKKQPRNTTQTKKRPRRSKSTKLSAVKIHAEMLRKRRMEERRVRQEELQLQQNAVDQERAQRIASRFETNTDELRLQRMQDRLDLLQKLNQKRIQVIQQEDRTQEKNPPVIVPEKIVTTQPSLESTENSASDDDDESSSDEEMELEIVGNPKTTQVGPATHVIKASNKSKALLILDFAANHSKVPSKKSKSVVSFSQQEPKFPSPSKSADARAALQRTLLAKQRKAGNLWLARELGYKTEEQHVKDCLAAEQVKRQRVLRLEEERLRTNERKHQNERRRLLQGEHVEDEPALQQDPPSEQNDQEDEEEDEEMQMAKEIQQEREQHVEQEATNSDQQEPGDVDVEVSNDKDKDSNSMDGDDSVATETPQDELESDDDDDDDDRTVAFGTLGADAESGETPLPEISIEQSNSESVDTESVDKESAASSEQDDTDGFNAETQVGTLTSEATTSNKMAEDAIADDTSQSSPKEDVSDVVPKQDGSEDEGETEFRDDEAKEPETEEPKKARNAAWQAMLKKEAEKIKKMKKRKGGLVDEEADEEEEEEVAGLEDFGFSLHKKNKNGDEEDVGNDELNDEDLKNIVDDVSDDEGDEEAGEVARKALEQKEEKERHKEIIRRMRDGYDGRRGGIAGAGVGARGIHRFDQLVAADNRDGAKRLGLLNDDEIDSDDEDGQNKEGDDKGANGEDEDENALLDKMLKDRFLHRSSVEQELEENFSEDEDEDNNEKAADTAAEDEEEKEQERLAKRFAKRARMQRLLETHADDKEFSQLRLMDEDESMKSELMKMKNVSSLSKRQSSISSSGTSFSGGSDSQMRQAPIKSVSNGTLKPRKDVGFGGLLANGGKLSLALQASRRSKRKTSFMGGSSKSGKETTASLHKSVALSHVVFHAGESQLSKSSSRSFRSRKKSATAGKRKRTSFKASTSLWTKVSANGFKKARV